MATAKVKTAKLKTLLKNVSDVIPAGNSDAGEAMPVVQLVLSPGTFGLRVLAMSRFMAYMQDTDIEQGDGEGEVRFSHSLLGDLSKAVNGLGVKDNPEVTVSVHETPVMTADGAYANLIVSWAGGHAALTETDPEDEWGDRLSWLWDRLGSAGEPATGPTLFHMGQLKLLTKIKDTWNYVDVKSERHNGREYTLLKLGANIKAIVSEVDREGQRAGPEVKGPTGALWVPAGDPATLW